MRTVTAILLSLSLMGCATMRRHPIATMKRHPVVTGLVAGAIVGGTIGIVTYERFCSYTYDGKPYYGTTCPKPKEK